MCFVLVRLIPLPSYANRIEMLNSDIEGILFGRIPLIWGHPSTQLSSNFSIILFCTIVSLNSYDRILKNVIFSMINLSLLKGGISMQKEWYLTSWWYLKLYCDVCLVKHIVRKVQIYDIKVKIGSGCDPNKLAYLLQMEHIPQADGNQWPWLQGQDHDRPWLWGHDLVPTSCRMECMSKHYECYV